MRLTTPIADCDGGQATHLAFLRFLELESGVRVKGELNRGTLFVFNPNIDNLPEHWEASYFPTHAILAVVAGNVSVPEQGSTFVLLTLGLLGLVMYRRQLQRRERQASRLITGNNL